MFKVIMAATALVVTVVGCSDMDAESASGSTRAASAGATSIAAPVVGDPVDEAVASFAVYADVDPADVEVVANEEVIWRDSSLGCPDPDTGYAQELVEGYRIVLRTGGEEVSFHGRNGMPPFYCADPDPEGTLDDRR